MITEEQEMNLYTKLRNIFPNVDAERVQQIMSGVKHNQDAVTEEVFFYHCVNEILASDSGFKCLLTTDDDRTNGISVQNKDTESTQKRKLLPVATMDCDSWTEENTENSSLGQETKRRKVFHNAVDYLPNDSQSEESCRSEEGNFQGKTLYDACQLGEESLAIQSEESTDDDLDLEETEDDVYIKILFGIHNQDLVQEDDRDTDEVCDTEDISSASSIAEKESAKPQQVVCDKCSLFAGLDSLTQHRNKHLLCKACVKKSSSETYSTTESRDVSLDDNKADRNVPNQDYKHKEKLGVIQGEDYAQNVEENTEQVCNTATSETSSTRIKSIAAPEFEVAATSVDDHIDLNEMDKDASIQSCAEEEKEDVIDVSEFQQRLQLCGKCSSLIGRDSFAQCRDGHLLCQTCVEMSSKETLLSPTEAYIKCLAPNCKQTVPLREARKVLPYIVMELLKEKSEKETFKLISDMDMMVLSPKEIGFRLINSNSSQKYCQICKKDLYQFSHVSCGSKTTQEWSPVSAPRYWAPFPPNFQQKYLLVNVLRESREFKRILRRVEVTYPNFGYNNPQISRIQNVHLWERYALARQHMVDDFGKGQLNEKLLFHGTEATFAHDICSEGFDWRLCGRNGTVYGKGCYFAKHASYSLKFSDRNEEKASGEYLYAIKYTRTLALSVPAWLQVLNKLPHSVIPPPC
ncbi:uncharacterized protein LOC112559334 isoform X4 [Pomacea canaliculata]|uniref:uncharacterized protein LOC112559334 isoform X4 n=1 Tax=Pomacea canaliculata TaxID=400727 RepID=UPI000D73A65F|nr:uncharacterized protein LOC112559334 isoform X4 [Pomacea canaliculata]